MLMRAAGLMLALSVAVTPLAHAADAWTEGRHYYRLQPARPTSTPAGTVELIEVFSYACPACNVFRPMLEGLKSSLPGKVRFVYVPASFNPAEETSMRYLPLTISVGVPDTRQLLTSSSAPRMSLSTENELAISRNAARLTPAARS